MINKKDFEDKKIVIIGAGISGLSLGWELAKKGFKPTILEKQKFAGGLAASIPHKGYMMDIGPHYVALPRKSEITNDIFSLMKEENVIELPSDIFYKFYKTSFNSRLYNGYPPLFEIIFNSGTRFLIKSVSSIILVKMRNFSKRKFYNYEDYLISQYGKFLFEIWFKPYLYRRFQENEPPLNDVMKQFPQTSFSKIIESFQKKSNSQIKSEKRVDKDEDNIICYFKKGMGELISRLEEEIINFGGNVKLGVDIKSIEHSKDVKQITYIEKDSEQTLDADLIIYSTPIDITIKWFESFGKKQNSNSSGIHCILVFLMIDAKKLFDSWVVNFYDEKISFSRIAQQNFLSESIVPKNKTLLSIEIKASEKNPLWQMKEEKLIEKIHQDLKKTGIMNNQKIDDFKILRLKNMYPNSLIKNDDTKIREEMNKFVNSFKNEFSLGIEYDSGVLATGTSENSQKITYGGGVYNAFVKSKNMAEVISSG